MHEYSNIIIPFISPTSLVIVDEASVVSSLMGRIFTIFSRNHRNPSFSMATELPPVSLLSTTAISKTTFVEFSIKVYTQYLAECPGESFLPAPHKHRSPYFSRIPTTIEFILFRISLITGAAQCFCNRANVLLLIMLRLGALDIKANLL